MSLHLFRNLHFGHFDFIVGQCGAMAEIWKTKAVPTVTWSFDFIENLSLQKDTSRHLRSMFFLDFIEAEWLQSDLFLIL